MNSSNEDGQDLTKVISNLPRPLRTARRRLGERLVETGVITPAQLTHALQVQSQDPNSFLGQILVRLGYVPAAIMGRELEEITGVSYVDLSTYNLDPNALTLLSEGLIRQRMLLPLKANNEYVWLAMADPLDLDVIDMVNLQTGRRVIPLLSLEGDLLAAINRHFNLRGRTDEVIRELEPETASSEEEATQNLAHEAENAPIVRLVHAIIDGAFDSGASDIHLEPQEDGLRVRYRIDGVLQEQMLLPGSNQAAVVSRIKVIGGMDIAERRRPQDGRISRVYNGRDFDLRVSTMPTVLGEKAVLRVLDKASLDVPLERIGFLEDELAVWMRLIHRPYGMVLVTGPTGSGKSTTLYASLNRINDPGKNIATVEDPVEYRLKGINQTQVNPRAGVTFATGLRTLVRQDPDIILVGEIRDRETAEVAVNAALTGHLVFATLHTNDAPGAVVRLENMGVETFLVTSSVLGVVGQRLLRKVCEGCKEEYTPDAALIKSLGLPPEPAEGNAYVFSRGKGCRDCNGSGYRGRTAVFEVMVVSEQLRASMLRRVSSDILKQQAIQDGMRPMRMTAALKIARGLTTPEEVARVILSEEE